MAGVGVYVSGTYAAFSILPQQSIDGGTTWINSTMSKDDLNGVGAVEALSYALAANAFGGFSITLMPGATHVRITNFFGAPASGTCNIRLTAGVIKAPNAQVVRNADQITAAAAFADAFANPTAGKIGNLSHRFNATTWDRDHGCYFGATGDTGAKTASGTGVTQTNFDSVGALITVRVGAVSGTTPTAAFRIEWSPDGGTTWFTLGAAAAALTAASSQAGFAVWPSVLTGLTLGTTNTTLIPAPLPRIWRVAWTIGGTTPSFTITAVDVNYVGD